jgi:hypothetical protein
MCYVETPAQAPASCFATSSATIAAAQYVEFAKRAAYSSSKEAKADDDESELVVFGNGAWDFVPPGSTVSEPVLMRARPCLLGTIAAMERALMSSAVTYKEFSSPPEDRAYEECWLGDRFAPGWTRDEARNALLDALLAPTATREAHDGAANGGGVPTSPSGDHT